MAELTTPTETTTNSCCAPEAQATCCEPSAKAERRDPSYGDGCGGCSAGKGTDEAPTARRHAGIHRLHRRSTHTPRVHPCARTPGWPTLTYAKLTASTRRRA